MVNENKKKVFAAVAGAVVGAGAVLAGAIAMSNKTNQKKVGEVLTKAKGVLKGYGEEVREQKVKSKENIKKVANKAIKSAELVTKAAKKEVKKI